MKFDYGDDVKIIDSADEIFRPGEIGSILGISIVDNDILRIEYSAEIGAIVYLVEYQDGTDIIIPERHLENFSKYNTN